MVLARWPRIFQRRLSWERVAWAVRQEAESAVRPELVPGVVLPVASGPGLPAWRFNNSTERHGNAEYGFATSLAGPSRKGGAYFPERGTSKALYQPTAKLPMVCLSAKCAAPPCARTATHLAARPPAGREIIPGQLPRSLGGAFLLAFDCQSYLRSVLRD